MSARTDLCGGRSAMIVPTATKSSWIKSGNVQCPVLDSWHFDCGREGTREPVSGVAFWSSSQPPGDILSQAASRGGGMRADERYYALALKNKNWAVPGVFHCYTDTITLPHQVDIE
jgi:hypothetical protein